MGIFSMMFPGLTGVPAGGFDQLGAMYGAAPPNLKNWLMGYGSQHMNEFKGPFASVMGNAFKQAPPDVQKWALNYAGQNKIGWLASALGQPAATPARPAAPIVAAAAPGGGPGRFLGALFRNESGGRNIDNTHQMTSSGQAQGYFQITTGTWKEFGGQALGYASPHDAPYNIQAEVASRIPMSRWDPSTLAAIRASGARLDPHATLGQNLAANGESFGGAPGGGHAAPATPLRPISSNPDAALVHAAGMASPSDPGPGAGLSAPGLPATPISDAAGGAAGAPPVNASAFRGGGVGGGAAYNPPMQTTPSLPLMAENDAQTADAKMRQSHDYLLPVADTLSAHMADVPALFGQANAPGGLPATPGVFQKLFAAPKLAESSQQIKYRA